jgi:hypothetical protein
MAMACSLRSMGITPVIDMLNHTARMTAEGLGAEYCKVMEYIPAENRLLVCAGVGWNEGVIGSASVGADLASPARYALRTGKPVISNHLENEQRFRTPELLVEHGIRRATNVILQGDGSPFGVLEVDSRSDGEFGEHDVAFLQGAAKRSNNSNPSANFKRRSIVIRSFSRRSTTASRIVCKWFPACFTCKRTRSAILILANGSMKHPPVTRPLAVLMSAWPIMPTMRILIW